LDQRLEENSSADFDNESAFARAKALLTDLSGYWNHLTSVEKPTALRALFPTGLSYIYGAIGTAQTPWLYGVTERKSAAEEGLVAPTRFELALPP
jgi:hypothetical protein